MGDPAERNWSEAESAAYRGLSDVAVPERERQLAIIADLVAASTGEGPVLDLCCGEGLIARALLERLPEGDILAYDGSGSMLKVAQANCGENPRLVTREIDLAARDWRDFERPLRAVASSLAIHHLDATGKRTLFGDILAALAPGGVFVLADVVQPATKAGDAVAAWLWDETVKERSLELRGDLSGFSAFQAADWNHFRHAELDPMDKPSTVAEHFAWLTEAGFSGIDLHWMTAGQAIFSGWKR